MAPPTAHVHALGYSGERVRWLPISPPGPLDLDGRALHHKPLAVGAWDADSKSHMLTILDVEVATRAGGRVEGVQFQSVVVWEHPGAFTDLQVADVGSGDDVLMVTGSSQGHVTVSHLLVPRMPGTAPQDIVASDVKTNSSGTLLPWATPHKGAVAAVAVHPDTKAILTAGADGALCILTLDSASGGGGAAAVVPFKAGTGYVSYTNARWADSQCFVTSSHVGGLELWDVRRGPRPFMSTRTALLPATFQAVDQQLQWLHVHPSRPNECASGASDGAVVLWDLRFAAQPVSCVTADTEQGGPVWEVRFDPHAPSTSSTGGASGSAPATPPIVFCSEGGLLGQVLPAGQPAGQKDASGRQQQGGPPATTALYPTSCAVNSFDIEATRGQDVVCVTDANTLVYISR